MKRLAVVIALVASACGGKANELPPHGEALVIVDTDLPVPQLASRLRVDLYGMDGRWFESRDIGRSDPRDWPASFSVFSDDDTNDKLVLVRLRAYPEGITRDYKGERFEPRPAWREPFSARSREELCANAPELPLGGRVTLRAGSTPLTDVVKTDQCSQPSASGSIAARVTIPSKGRYRFDVASALPYVTWPSLALRASCTEPGSQLACQVEPPTAGAYTPGHFPRFDVELDPGTYFLVTTNFMPAWPSDITLEGMPVDAPLPNPAPLTSEAPADPELPRLVRDGSARDDTPESEPLPSATVDRLLLVRLAPGARSSVRVTLKGACAGTMARLGAEPGRPDARAAQTCIDTEDVRVPLAEAPLDPDLARPTTTVQGTFGRGQTCGEPGREDVACIPGGAFLFGSRTLTITASTRAATAPERIAMMSRFWLDRHEVTVARLRAAIARGFTFDPADLHVNNGAFPSSSQAVTGTAVGAWCSWSATPIGREDYPVSCVNWRLARAFCRFEGGDLPSEAQWEYAAGAAGRPFKVAYPWGDEKPTCDRTIIGRAPGTIDASFCVVGRTAGPAAVSAMPPGDVTPLGVFGMAGNLQEWTLDGAQPLSGECWRAAGLVDPRCPEEEAPLRVLRGGCWASAGETVSDRNDVPGGLAANGIPAIATSIATGGFRCAYAEPPR